MNRHDTLLLYGGSEQNRKMLRSVLEENYNLLETSGVRQLLVLLRQNLECVAAVVVDITDPELVSRELLDQPESSVLLTQVPLIMVSGNDDHDTLALAFGFGAADVIPLDYDSDAMLKRIGNIVELSLHKRNLEALIQEQADILRHSNDVMVDALTSIIEYRSMETGRHILRIRHFTRLLLEEVARSCPEYGLTEQNIRIISSASALHDIGKIAIPDAILMKPTPLTQEEWQVMKAHAVTGCEILQRLGGVGNREYLRYAYNICRYHHERWDGGGYPEGLAGEDIPICAQVTGLVDAYDALTSKRVYKDACSFEVAANMILNGECGTFSPKLLECFKRVTSKLEALARAYADGMAPETERFDTTLPGPGQQENSSIDMTRAKYLALVHYINAFLIELDMDQGLFHLIYNPFPEMTRFQNINSFADIEHLLVERLVVPEEQPRMKQFLYEGLENFLSRGHRRASFRFHFRGKEGPEPFEITLLRINPSSPKRTLAVLCRRVNSWDSGKQKQLLLSDSTYVCRVDEGFTLERFNGNTDMLAGYSLEEIRQHFDGRLIELVYPEDRESVRRAFREQLSRGTDVELEHRVRRRDGSVLWVLNKSRLVVEADGRELLHCFLTNISHTKEALDRLAERLSRYEIILAQTENVLFEWDVRTDTISFSDTWERIFGFPPISRDVMRELRGGANFHPDDLPRLLDCIRNLESGSHYEMVEVRVASAAGRYIWCRFRASAIRDEAGCLTKIVGIIINIDVEKLAEYALKDRAERDALTKLLNKSAGRKQAEEYLEQYPQGVHCALLVIDLDNFKQVNDEYGHLFGDAVLTRTAQEIKKLFRTQDILTRIGGDEFMVLMRGVSDRLLVEKRCSQLLRSLGSIFRDQGDSLPLSCSIGIAMAPEDGTTYHALFRKADQALYQAKNRGKSGFTFYDGTEETARPHGKRPTSLNNSIDSDDQPGLADNSLVQYAFQQLYAARDVDAAVNELLRLVGEQMNVSRVYVFENSPDNRFCSNTYEWCNRGIEPQIRNLQHISYAEDIPGYQDNYDENGIFYCPDIGELPRSTYEIVEAQGIKSMLHCAIREGGVFRGYIGFDECTTKRLWTREQIDTLTYFSETLSVFLLKKRAQERDAQRVKDLSSILDNQKAWIYIIDPETCELKYLNARTRTLAPDVREGMLCYKALVDRSCRCEGCPSRNIRRDGTASAILCNDKFGLRVLAEATKISWEGKDACLMTCRELPE